jgi:hypothetical protein
VIPADRVDICGAPRWQIRRGRRQSVRGTAKPTCSDEALRFERALDLTSSMEALTPPN